MVSPQDSIDLRARDSEWVALIKRVAEGEQDALATFYDRTSRLAYGLILRIVADAATAEEVALDVYKQVWRTASRYSSERGSPLAWLLTIARTRSLDRLRAGYQVQTREQPLELVIQKASSAANPEEETELAERQRLVRSALTSLSAEQREVIELAYYSGMSHSEIALQLGQPLGTVKTRIRLAMVKLRDLLKPLLEES